MGKDTRYIYLMKHFSCSAMIRYEILTTTVIYLWIVCVLFFLNQESLEENLYIPTVLYAIALIMNCLHNRNAFVRYTINDTGIANKSIFMKWEDMKEYDVVEIKRGIFPVLFRKRVYCFGCIPNDTFYFLDPRKTIFFSITPKIMEELQNLSDGKSEAINHISQRYNGI